AEQQAVRSTQYAVRKCSFWSALPTAYRLLAVSGPREREGIGRSVGAVRPERGRCGRELAPLSGVLAGLVDRMGHGPDDVAAAGPQGVLLRRGQRAGGADRDVHQPGDVARGHRSLGPGDVVGDHDREAVVIAAELD